MKIENCKLKIALFALLFLLSGAKSADAGFLINRPLYIGLADGLVGYWSFNGSDMNATQARDTSGNGNHGTLTNGPVRTEGKIGQALNFDGVDDVVNAGSATSLDDLGPMTASAWIYPRSQGEGNAGAIVFKGTAASIGFWRFSLIATNALQFTEDPKTDLQRTSSNNAITLNTWQHVAVTWDGSNTAANARIYVNGAEVSYQTTTDGLGLQSDAALDFFIGNDSAGGVTFDGLIDEVRVYNRVLSTDEIKRLYKMGATTKINVPRKDTLTNGLAGYWTFDGPDMAVDTAFDRSGNANNGTLTNSPVRTEGKIGQALEFDGVDDLINLGSPTALDNVGGINGPRTITAWIYPTGWGEGNFGRIWYKTTENTTGWRLQIENDGVTNIATLTGAIGGTSFANAVAVDNTLSLNKWQFVVMTWAGTIGSNAPRLYVGSPSSSVAEVNYQSTSAGSGTQGSDVADIAYIGNRGAGDRTFKGLIDEVRVYDRALSADEIKRLYKMGATTKINVPRKDTLTNGLAGYWTFDGPDIAVDTAFDRSGNANNGTLTNGPVRTEGKIGQALNFDGVNDYVNMGTPSVLNFDNTNFSVCAWTRPIGTGFSPIVSRGGYGQVTTGGWFFGTNQIATKVSNGDTAYVKNSSVTPVANVWQFLCATGKYSTSGTSGQSFNFYYNGVLANGTESNLFATNSSSAFNVEIATRSYSGGVGQYGTGLIDEVRIYNRALSADEIKRLYNMGR